MVFSSSRSANKGCLFNSVRGLVDGKRKKVLEEMEKFESGFERAILKDQATDISSLNVYNYQHCNTSICVPLADTHLAPSFGCVFGLIQVWVMIGSL